MFTKKPESGSVVVDGAPKPPAPPKPPLPPGVAASSPAAAAPAPATRSGEKLAPTVIGADMTVVGNLQSKGEVQVEGVIQGDLHGVHVVVGERARITGGIMADDVIVRGHVEGSIRGLRVTLQSSSKVEGDVYHQSLAIEQGAYFEGKSRRAEDPMANTNQKAPQSATASAPAGAGQKPVAPAASNGAAGPSSSRS